MVIKNNFESSLQRQKNALKTKLIKKTISWLLVSFFISFIVWSVAYSPLFRISSVEILGLENHNFPTFVHEKDFSEIVATLKSDSTSSLIVFNEKKLAKQIADKYVSLKNVQVAKSWPNKIVIIVEPREPEANFNGVLIDSEGVELGEAKNDNGYPLLEITNPEVKADCLAILKVANESGFSSQKVTATTRDDVTIFLKDGRQIVFGNINKMTLKIADAKAIINSDKMQGHSVLDVSAPTSPVMR